MVRVTPLRRVLVLTSVAFFALALGIALGGGALQDDVRAVWQSQVDAVTGDERDREARLVRQKRALERSARFDQVFAEQVAPDLLGDELDGRATLVLALPGVPESVAQGLVDDIEASGGAVTTSLRFGPDLVAPAARPLVDELSKRLVDDTEGLDGDVPDEASVYTRAGLVLGRALVTSEDGGTSLDDDARSLFSTFTTAGLLRGEEPQQRADTVAVLVPQPGRPGTTTAGRHTIFRELVRALDAAGDGVVVAGPPQSADPRGLVAAVRSSGEGAAEVSTVDAVTLRAGRVVTALALAQQAKGESGHYGVGPGAESVLP